MALSGAQIARLADAIAREWSQSRLVIFARDEFSLEIENMSAPSDDLKKRALRLLEELNKFPSKDGLLLDLLRHSPNQKLRDLATEFLNPSYFPPGDPHRAIIVGGAPFVGRDGLRAAMRDFTNPQINNPHVMFIQGPRPCGKSYSWVFVRHLAQQAGAQFQTLQLHGTDYTPRDFFEQIFLVLGLDTAKLPPMADQPQLARIDAPLNAFKGAVGSLDQPIWLLIDDLNDPAVTPPVLEAAHAVASAVERNRPPNLWIILIGYNDSIESDDVLRWAGRDDSSFPDVQLVAKHFEALAQAGPEPISASYALELAKLLFSEGTVIDKPAMTKLTDRLRLTGEMLRNGEPIA